MPGGAEDVVAQDGLVGVDRIFALHCDPALDAGQVGLRVGAITAAADQVEVTLSGRVATRPARISPRTSLTRSPRSSPTSRACSHAGSTPAPAPRSSGAPCTPAARHNVIPSIGKVGGTLRMLDASVWEGVERLLEEVVHAVVAPYAVQAEVLITKGVPPVVNDASCIDSLTAAVAGAGAHVASTPQSLGGEDFAWYLTHVPGAMARLGTRTPGGPTYDLHRGDLVVDEAAIAVGARTLAGAGLHLCGLGRRLAGPGRRCSPRCGRGSVTLPGRSPARCRSCRSRVYSSVLCGPMSSSAPRNLRSTPCVTQPRSRLSSRLPRWASRPAEAAPTRPPPGSNTSAGSTAPATGKKLVVGIAYGVGGRGDQSFNASAAAGLDKAKADLGVEFKEATQVNGESEAAPRSASSSSSTPAPTPSSASASPTPRPSARSPRRTPTSSSRSSTTPRPTRRRQRRAADLRRGAGLLPRRRRRRPQVARPTTSASSVVSRPT